jgi:hypothetical protein
MFNTLLKEQQLNHRKSAQVKEERQTERENHISLAMFWSPPGFMLLNLDEQFSLSLRH